jgi:hypothetical protein
MDFLLEVAFEPTATDAPRTLVLEAGEKYSDLMSGNASDGLRSEGSWVALEGGIAYLVLDATDDAAIHTLCHEVTSCAPGVWARVIPVLPVKRLRKRLV